jgi:hypothetical protein
MPTEGREVSATGVAKIYQEVRELCSAEPPVVVIERIFTPPTDAVSKKRINQLEELYKLVREILAGNETDETKKQVEELVEAISETDGNELRLDGRVGLQRYSQGAGRLEMGKLWDWPVVTVSPKTWMAEMFKHVPSGVKAKDRARKVVADMFPEIYVKGQDQDFWPDRAKKPLDYACDSLCMAIYARRKILGNEKSVA